MKVALDDVIKQVMNIIAIIFWAIMLTVIVVIYRKWFGES